jgi:hypothetical protein
MTNLGVFPKRLENLIPFNKKAEISHSREELGL